MRPVLVWGRHGLLAEALRRNLQHQWPIHFWGRGELPTSKQEMLRKIQILRPAAVINASGFTQLMRAQESPCLSWELHVEIPAYLAACSRNLAVPFLTLSTDYVFSGEGKSSWNESDPTTPINAYGKSKLMGERAVMAQYPRAKIVRTAGLFGPAPAGSKVSFPERIIQQARAGNIPVVRSDLTTSICHVDDLVADLWQILWNTSAGVFHVVHAGSATWLQIAECALKSAGLPTRVLGTLNSDFPRPPCSALTTLRAETQAGRATRKTWQESLSGFIRGFRHHA